MGTQRSIVITGAKRTPMGAMNGVFASVSATALGSFALEAALKQSTITPSDVNEVYFGNVISAGLQQAPARQVALNGGLPSSVPCTTINKVCGSGMKSVMIAANQIQIDHTEVIVAGGMESMSNAPYLLPKARNGYKLGHGQLLDSLFFDGLEDVQSGDLMGVFGQITADKCQIDRKEMDSFAIQSLTKAQQCIAQNQFNNEITPVTFETKKGAVTVDTDEQPYKTNIDKIPQLKPAFKKNGSVTAASSSSMSDGAAALVLMSESVSQSKHIKPLARIVGYTSHAQAPAEFCLAPIGAINKLLHKIGWNVKDVDLFEINEAFAVVALAAIKSLKLDPSKVNINGGACALGHPLGASGARLLVTLIYSLLRLGKTRGVASLCIGGGEATAMAIEVIHHT